MAKVCPVCRNLILSAEPCGFCIESRRRTRYTMFMGSLPAEEPTALPSYTRDLIQAYNTGPTNQLSVGVGVTTDLTLPYVWGIHNVGNPGANKCLWIGELLTNAFYGEDGFAGNEVEDPLATHAPVDPSVSVIGWLGRSIVYEAIIYTDVINGQNSGLKCGIALGVNNVHTLTASPANPIVALYQKWDTAPTWELLVCRGGAAASVQTLSAAAPVLPDAAVTNVGRCYRVKIEYTPALSVTAYINGISVGTMSDTSKMPAVGYTGKLTGPTMFFQTGSSAAAELSTAFWAPRITTVIT